MPKYRITKCEDNDNKEVIQTNQFGEWLCLHNESDMLDQVAVDAFKSAFFNEPENK